MNPESNSGVLTAPTQAANAVIMRSSLSDLATFGVRELVRPAKDIAEYTIKTGKKAGTVVPAHRREAAVVGTEIRFVPNTLAEIKAHCRDNKIAGKERTALIQSFLHSEHIAVGNQAAKDCVALAMERGGIAQTATVKGDTLTLTVHLPKGADKMSNTERKLRAENAALQDRLAKLEAMVAAVTTPAAPQQ